MAKQNQNKKSGGRITTAALPFWQHRHFFKGLVFVFAFCLFINSIPNDYNMDDELVTINHRLTSKGVSAIPEIFTSPYYQDAMGYSYEYRPVVLASFAIEHQVFGDNPHVSHFLNVLLYSLCCIVLFSVLIRLFKTQSTFISVAITLLFAAHPAHTEVVCSIKNRDEILALLFGFLALLTALTAIQNSKRWMLILMPLFFLLALMSKVTIISFVILIPLTLIFFTEASFGIIFLTTVLLQIPGYFLLNLSSSGIEKILVQLGITTSIAMFYLLINPKECLAKAKSFVRMIEKLMFQVDPTKNRHNTSETNKYGLRDVFKGIVPPKKMLSILPIVITGILACLYLLGISDGYSFYALLPFSVLVLLSWKGEEKMSWWADVMIGLSLSLNLYTVPFWNETLAYRYSTFLLPYLAFQLVYGKRSLFFPSLISLLILNYFNVKRYNNWDLAMAFLPVFFTLNRYVRYVLMLVLLVFSVEILDPNKDNNLTDLISFIAGFAVLLVIHFRKGQRLLLLLLLLICLHSFHNFQITNDKKTTIKQTIGTISFAANQVNPKIISTPQDRPLAYVEECISMQDPVSIRLGTSLGISFHYLQKVILPYPLAFYYGYKIIEPKKITDVIPVISLLLHLLLLMAALLLLHKERIISYGLFVYLISIVVFSNYLQFVPGMLADRFLLVPSLGWCIICVTLVHKIFKLKDSLTTETWNTVPAKAKYTFTGILLLYSILSFSRNFNWKDRVTLFRHDITYVEKSSQAHNLLALHLMQQSERETDPVQQTELKREALIHFKKAQEIYPRFFNVAYDIGRVYVSMNIPDSAITAFKYALTIDTSFREVQFNIGKLLFERDRLEEAIPYFENVIQFNPSEYKSYDQLSYLFFRLNKVDKSIEVNRRAISHLPSLTDPYVNIGRAYLGVKQLDSARYYFQKANEIAPGNPAIQQLLQQVSAP